MSCFNFDKDEQLQHPIIQRYRKVLKKTSDDGVFILMADGEKELFLLECCDNFFHMDLEKEDCLELSALFKDLAEELEK